MVQGPSTGVEPAQAPVEDLMLAESNTGSRGEGLEPEVFAPSRHAAETVVPDEAGIAEHVGSVASDIDEQGSTPAATTRICS